MDYLKKLEQPNTELQDEISRQRAERQLSPEEAERRAEKASRVAEVLGEAVLLQQGDPRAVSREQERQETRDAAWEASDKQAELDRAYERRDTFAD